MLKDIGIKAQKAAEQVKKLDSDLKNKIIDDMSSQLLEDKDSILDANNQELRKKALEATKIEAKKRKQSKTSRNSKIPKRSLLLSKKSRERSLQMQVSEEEDTPRLFDADALSEGTPSSPHSWMCSDQATQSSLHSCRPRHEWRGPRSSLILRAAPGAGRPRVLSR